MAFRINSFGVREGEVILGVGEQTRGCRIQIRGQYPPSQVRVSKLSDTDLRDYLNNFSFFANKTPKERKKWLVKHQVVVDDLYLDDIPDMEMKFLEIRGSFMIESLGDNVDRLLTGDFYPVNVIMNMFPRNPGSNAKHNTLVFRPGNWMLEPDVRSSDITEYKGIGYDLYNKSFVKLDLRDVDYYFLNRLGRNKVAIFMERDPHSQGETLSYQRYSELAVSRFGLDVEAMGRIYDEISWFRPSTHKSLIQKLIRTRCLYVESISGLEKYSSREVLVTSFLMLLVHPGALLPELQRFVSGAESAFKRLAVAICEDSYLDKQEHRVLANCLILAWMCQVFSYGKAMIWDEMVLSALDIGLKALAEARKFEYNWHEITNQEFEQPIRKWNTLLLNFAVLKETGSFGSDERMLLSIANNKGIASETTDQRTDEQRIMNIYHCIDQHCYPEVFHYMKYRTVRRLGDYGAVSRMFWDRLVGINGRGQGDEGRGRLERELKTAQRIAWMAAGGVGGSKTMVKTGRVLKIRYRLDNSWLAAFIGSQTIKGCIAVVNPSDIFTYKAIRKPGRNNKSPLLSEDEEEKIVSQLKKQLRKGIDMTGVPDTLPLFKGARVRLDGDRYMVMLKNSDTEQDWEDLVDMTYKVPILQDISSILDVNLEKGIDLNDQGVLEACLVYQGQGVVEKAKAYLDKYLRSLPEPVLQRAMIYVGYNSNIRLYKIGRKGESIDYEVKVEDTAVNHLLSVICLLYPAALRPSGGGYRVGNGPLFWSLRDRIVKILGEKGTAYDWPAPKKNKRKLWSHQQEAVDDLIRDRQNHKAHLMWIDTGLGKTFIVINYLVYLMKNGMMPKYCIYILPSPAYKSVLSEFKLLKIPSVHINPCVSAGKGRRCQLEEGHVNFIFHHHLIKMDRGYLMSVAPDSFLVVDEFHKTLNYSKLTSTALQLACLSREVIGMTGTMIKDSNIALLIPWLSMAVSFEVLEPRTMADPTNFWVAICSVISRRVELEIMVNRVVVQAKMNEEESEVYYGLVPAKLGGRAQKIDFRGAVEESYVTVERKILSRVKHYLRAKTGVFVVARDKEHQERLRGQLAGVVKSRYIFVVSKTNMPNFTPVNSPPPGQGAPWVVIATHRQAEGYNLSLYTVMITGVYFTNQATRDQLEGRIVRMNQEAKEVTVEIIHAGILSYIHRHYEAARSLSAALKGFSKEINQKIDYSGL